MVLVKSIGLFKIPLRYPYDPLKCDYNLYGYGNKSIPIEVKTIGFS